MPRKLTRRFLDATIGTPWERLLRRARLREATRFIIFWNRGLGDIPLGLHQVVVELKEQLPAARITVVTRAELAECFELLPVDEIVVDPKLSRADRDVARQSMRRAGLVVDPHDVVLASPDPTRWFRNGRRRQPRLVWPGRFDALARRFDALFDAEPGDWIDIAVHVSSETATFYTYRKDWPLDRWQSLFDALRLRHPVRFVLLGLARDAAFDGMRCVDLRGRTSLLEMLSVIMQRCRLLIAPDSGVLTMAYCLDVARPLDVVSLWSDPRQGILKNGMASPNPLLRHIPLVGADEQVERISVDEVVSAVEQLLADSPVEAH